MVRNHVKTPSGLAAPHLCRASTYSTCTPWFTRGLDDLSTLDGLNEPLKVIHWLILAIDSVFENPRTGSFGFNLSTYKSTSNRLARLE